MRLFVGAIRNLDLFRKLYHKLENYDSVVGKIADDSTSRVLTSYVTGLFGNPGSDLSFFAIQSLMPTA